MSALQEQVRRARTRGRRPIAQPDPDPSVLGHDLRISLSADIEACHESEAAARANHQNDRLAELQAQEADLWDALGNTQQLP
jgi:hypothetical protein